METPNLDKHIPSLAPKPPDAKLVLLVGVALVLLTTVAYWQIRSYGFVMYDDPIYVSENAHVLNGFTKEGIIRAFTSAYSANWHPVTWISLMLDGQLFGNDARGYHITNLLLHLANTLLLFGVLMRLTRALGRSAFVAALFAIHPLHVESVAWIAERKDVLSAFFGMLTLWFYVSYVRNPSIKTYVPVFVFLGIGLMAKSMLVTLPCVLLLLDYWPLHRMNFKKSDSPSIQAENHTNSGRKGFGFLVYEKLPLLIPVAVTCVLTVIAQHKGETIKSLQNFDIPLRIANALVSYVSYVGKMFWPSHLAVIYPHPTWLPWWQWIGALIFLVGISLLVFWPFRHRRYLLVGWLWYLGTLIPVIGLIQVGDQALADRYTYIPLIGLFIMIGWGIADLTKSIPYQKPVLTILGVLVLSALSVCTWQQVGHWRNSISLFDHTLAVTENNYIAHNNLASALKIEAKKLDEEGNSLEAKRKIDEAIQHWKSAIQIYPSYSYALENLSITLLFQNQPEEAMIYARRYLDHNPHDEHIQKILTKARTLRLNLNQYRFHFNKGEELRRQNRWNEAIRHYRNALKFKPEDPKALQSLKDTQDLMKYRNL